MLLQATVLNINYKGSVYTGSIGTFKGCNEDKLRTPTENI